MFRKRRKNKGFIAGIFDLVETISYNKEKQEERKILSQDNVNLDNLTGQEFEFFLEILFNDLGYKAIRTSQSGDFGADLIISKDNRKTAIQAKRYKSKVGIRAIQEVSSSKKYYKVNSTAVVTTNYFTEAAIKLAKINDVTLIDRDVLVKLISTRNKAE